jgi:hypothetical protein
MHWQQIKKENRKGFQIVFSVSPETTNPGECFDESLIDDVIEGIDSGRYEWFIARVEACRHGIKLAEDYLGGCLYESFDDFCKPGDYYDDMIERVIDEAKNNIQLLNEEIKS